MSKDVEDCEGNFLRPFFGEEYPSKHEELVKEKSNYVANVRYYYLAALAQFTLSKANGHSFAFRTLLNNVETALSIRQVKRGTSKRDDDRHAIFVWQP